MPLWNFFQISSGKDSDDLKYLIAVPDRLDYEKLVISDAEKAELITVWDKIFAEYNTLEKNYSVANHNNNYTKILYYYSMYLQEHGLIKSLLYRTNVNYLRFLRQRGYTFNNTSQAGYWQSLSDALQKVENHITYINILKAKIKSVDGEAKADGNPYDSIMAWIASNNINVDENVSVARYIKVKEIIEQRIKAKKKQGQPQLQQ